MPPVALGILLSVFMITNVYILRYKHARFIAYFRILRKAIFENFICKRSVGMLFDLAT